MERLNATHDPSRRSWVEDANEPGCDFPIQNLPFGVFRRPGGPAQGGVAIGAQVFDLAEALEAGLLAGAAAAAARAATGPTLNPLLGMPKSAVSELRSRLSDLLRSSGPDAASARALRSRLLAPLDSVQLELPIAIGAYTDFSCSFTHMGGMRGGQPATAFFYVPIAYNGRASSVRASGFPVPRPHGQWAQVPPEQDIRFGPEPRLDFELEFGAFVGAGNELGTALTVDAAESRIFGCCLLNDWSARGIQFFESLLGPFLGKSFLTTISPWIVTAEALAPFRVPLAARAEDVPAIPTHLDSETNRAAGGLDIELTAYLQTAKMRSANIEPVRIVRTDFRHMYWTLAQMLAHHTSNGCNLQAGDLLASGTTSGPEPDAKACLAEINQRGARPLELPGGEERLWLEDGDSLQIRGMARREGYVSIGFGACDGLIAAAVPWSPKAVRHEPAA
jgi:fumarylacetoacetase